MATSIAPAPRFEGDWLVRKAGISEAGKVRIEMRPANDPAAAYCWYSAPPTLQREYLSIAMAAIVSNKSVLGKVEKLGVDDDLIRYFGIVK